MLPLLQPEHQRKLLMELPNASLVTTDVEVYPQGQVLSSTRGATGASEHPKLSLATTMPDDRNVRSSVKDLAERERECKLHANTVHVQSNITFT